LGRGRGSPGPKAGDDETGLGSGGEEARRPVQEGLRVDLPLRLHAPPERGGFLVASAHGRREVDLDGALRVRQQGGGGRREQAHPLGGGKAGWHTGGEVEVPEGVHLEFLPSGSPELQPAERLWPLANEALANRLFEELEELEEALADRCVRLLDQTEAIRDLTNYH